MILRYDLPFHCQAISQPVQVVESGNWKSPTYYGLNCSRLIKKDLKCNVIYSSTTRSRTLSRQKNVDEFCIDVDFYNVYVSTRAIDRQPQNLPVYFTSIACKGYRTEIEFLLVPI